MKNIKLWNYNWLSAWVLFLFVLSTNCYAQDQSFRGVVVNEQGLPLDNATIEVKNKKVKTEKNGNFIIETSRNNIASVSKEGYRKIFIRLNENMTVILKAEVQNELVQELYGTRPESQINASISTLNGKEISNNTVHSFGNILYGSIPGLHVSQGAGFAGDDAPKAYYVRGKHTFSGSNDPLVLIDGFERPLSSLNVEEVDNISVLKDAASTVLYGMDGANGVILVTTRRGEKTGLNVSFKSEFGVEMPTELPEFYNSYDFAKAYNSAQINDGVDESLVRYTNEQLAGYKDHTDGKLYPDVNWFNETLKPYSPPTQKYVLNISGGNNVGRFFVNVGYRKTEGLYKDVLDDSYNSNNSSEIINFRSNLDIKVREKLLIKVDLSGYMENKNSPRAGDGSIWSNLYRFNPNTTAVYAEDGAWGGTNNDRNNPVAYINDQGYTRNHNRLLQSNITFDYDFSDYVKGLHGGARAAFDSYYSVDNGYSKSYAVKEVTGVDSLTNEYLFSDYGINSILDDFGPSNENQYSYNSFEAYLDYALKSGKNHTLNSKLIYHQDSRQTSTVSYSPDRRINVSGALSYAYKDRYLVDLGAQYGGCEEFIKGRRFGWYPAVSAGWILSKEHFMQELDAISFLKLRASVGRVGNQNVGGTRFGYRQLYASSGSWNAGTSNAATASGVAESDLGNVLLTWEKSLKTDIGLEAVLFKNLSVSLTYFKEKRYDILRSASYVTPSFLGAKFSYVNNGEVQASGFEPSVSYKKQYKDWGYNVSLNAAYQTNAIISTQQVAEDDLTGSTISYKGKSIDQPFARIFEGFYTEEDIANGNYTLHYGNVIPGSMKYGDYVAYGSDADVPDWEFGQNLGINYKGFYINAHIQACLGKTINMLTSASYSVKALQSSDGYVNKINKWIKNPWTAELAADPQTAKTIDYPSLSIENSSVNWIYSTFWMKDGSFLRLRTLEIGYDLPSSMLSNFKVHGINIYIRGNNIFTLDHLKYFDPEILQGYPLVKSFNIGVSIKI